MPEPVDEVKEICETLTPENQHTLLRYAQIAHVAENAVRKSSDNDENQDS